MDDFIKSATSQLGLNESVARTATGTVLGFLKNSLGDDFASVAEKLPGADQLIDSAATVAPRRVVSPEIITDSVVSV